MKKRMFSGVCALVFCLGLLCAPAPVRAAGNPYFMAVNDNLLSLEDRFIPIVANGRYYVPYTALDSNVTGLALGIFPIYNSMRNTLVIYSRDQVLSFDLSTGVCTDRNNAVLSARSVTRNEQIYVPIVFICEYFSLEFSVRNTTYGLLVRVRSETSVLDDNTFVGLAQLLMEDRLREWRKSQTSEETSTPGVTPAPAVPTPSVTPTPAVPTPGPSTTDKSDVQTYLAFRADQISGLNGILERLAQYQVQALFFFPANQLAEYDGAVRTVLCRGHGVGLLVSGVAAEEIMEQATQGNRLLAQIAHLNTHTILAPNLKDSTAFEQFEEAGFFCWNSDIDTTEDGWGGSAASTAAERAAGLLETADLYREKVRILFGATVTGTSLLTRVLPEMVQNRYDLRLAVETEL